MRLLGLSDAWMAWSFFQAGYSVGCEMDVCVGLGWCGRRTRGESSAHDYQCHDERDPNYVISPSKCVSHRRLRRTFCKMLERLFEMRVL